ncbi:MAG: DUF456 domain-containing protein [Phycisphaerales bacterium]|jgi:uncharacterized protein YqgC (DUF456 family)|nr:DUF456 domain-containing protein [Phycisphaerales bacterium]
MLASMLGNWDWAYLTIGVAMTLVALAGVALTLLTFSGAWLIVLVAIVCNLWQPGTFSWWTIGLATALAALAEVLEFTMSAAGTRKVGGSRAAAWWSIAGSIGGAIAGTILIPIPILGTIVGGVLGAGIAAALAERGVAQKTWRDSARAGKGAAVGRLASTFVKGGITAVIGLMMTLAAWF